MSSSFVFRYLGSIPPVHQMERLDLSKVHQIVVHTEFSRLPGGLGELADSNSIPWDLSTIRYPNWTAVARELSTLRAALSAIPFVSER